MKQPAAAHGRFPLRNWLALIQVAASLVALTATGALVQSFWNRRYGDIGLARKNVLAGWQSGTRSLPLDQSVIDRVRGIGGVKDVAVAFRAPMSFSGGGISLPVRIPGHPAFSSGQAPAVTKYNTVDERYFPLLGIRLLRGRAFDSRDIQGSAPVAVVSEAFARRYWPDEDPVGRSLVTEPRGKTWQIVGVVADAPVNGIGEIPEPYFYLCWWQAPVGEYTLLLETQGEPLALAGTLRATLKQIDERLARVDITSLDELVRLRTNRYLAMSNLVAALGGLGLILTAIGLYGVLGYGVTLRRREIGIRMALGAQAAQAQSLVVGQGFRIAIYGIVLGVPLAAAALHLIRTTLYGIAPWHAPAFALAALLMIAVALVASWLPARRASRVDPMTVLREE
jgi:predicted permease